LDQAGHDVATVVGQGMTSATDVALLAACNDEGRCVVTMDLDFANPMRFDPSTRPGIAVLRADGPLTTAGIEQLITTLVEALATSSIEGKLWIVESGRIREYTPERA
jgi:predicted nuclease of predicted toxin-antitoxin system